MFWLIVVFFVMWEVAFFEIHDDVSDMVPMVRAFGWTSAWEAYCSIMKELYASRRGRKAIGSQTSTPSSRRSYGEHVAPMAWGA